MIKLSFFIAITAAGTVLAAPPTTHEHVSTNRPTASEPIPIQEVLVTGHSGLKLHALSMISQGKVESPIDGSFLPGFEACAMDSAIPIRSVTARIIGEHMIAHNDAPNPAAIELLVKLARDESNDVRHSAVYYGLTQLTNKSDYVLSLLIDVAAAHREKNLYNRIIESVKGDRERITALLDKKLELENEIAFFEIYADFVGKAPTDTKKFLDMPSSRPRVYIFRSSTAEAEPYKDALTAELKKAGLENPELIIAGSGGNYILLLKTYLTSDRLIVEKAFQAHPKFTITQEMWLTPELEIQFEKLQTKKPTVKPEA